VDTDAFDKAERALTEVHGIALADVVQETESPELTEELIKRLWALLTKTTVTLAIVHGSTPREILEEGYKHVGDEAEFRAEIERQVEELRSSS
jgi:hypothetical protein